MKILCENSILFIPFKFYFQVRNRKKMLSKNLNHVSFVSLENIFILNFMSCLSGFFWKLKWLGDSKKPCKMLDGNFESR